MGFKQRINARTSGGEIWIAEGTYSSIGLGYAIRDKADIHLYGGFAGNENVRDERDWQTNITFMDRIFVRNVDNLTFDGFSFYELLTDGAVLDILNSSPSIQNCIFGYGIFSQGGSPTIFNCIFTGISAGVSFYAATPKIINCRFENNEYSLGANYSKSILINCVMVDNTRYASYWEYSSLIFRNCTIVNTLLENGYGHNPFKSSITIINSILWDETEEQIFLSDRLDISISHSCIKGGFEGIGNTSEDPLFVDANNGNYQLNFASPCIDTGIPDSAPIFDIEGIGRPQGAGIDIGAYEYPVPVEGEGEGEGEGEAPADPEGEGEGEAPAESEGEGEGEAPADPEGEQEGEALADPEGEDEINSYELIIQIYTLGSGVILLESSDPTYNEGTKVDLNVSPHTGWTFDHWEGNVQDPDSASTTIIMNEAETITAVFVEQNEAQGEQQAGNTTSGCHGGNNNSKTGDSIIMGLTVIELLLQLHNKSRTKKSQ